MLHGTIVIISQEKCFVNTYFEKKEKCFGKDFLSGIYSVIEMCYTEYVNKEAEGEIKMYDILAFGEMLIDFTPVGISEAGNPLFERNPGGGPANMICAAAKMGASTAFIGKVGSDPFGQALRETLEKNGVEATGLILDSEYPTTLAFVHLSENGERSFSFYRHGGADTMYDPSEIPLTALDNSRYFFCSSVMMAEGPSRQSSFALLESAHEKGIPVVFDPNLRPNLWAQAEEMRKVVLQALPYADIVKVSEEEAQFLTEMDATEPAAEMLLRTYSPSLLLVTCGSRGCLAYCRGRQRHYPGFAVQAVDTTAAGDTFTGAFLAKLAASGKDLVTLCLDDLDPMVTAANAAGALTTTRKGSISALPRGEEVDQFLREHHSCNLC